MLVCKKLEVNDLKSDSKIQEMKTNTQKTIKKDTESREYAELVVLKPVGYPFEFSFMDEEV